MITLEKLIQFIGILLSDKFYGDVVIKIENGIVKQVNKTEKFIDLK